MVPNWTIPNAIALGNCMILKPSELVPLSSIRIAELLREAGLPEGVFQVVHGGKEAVEAICDHPDIAAVSFVGSTKTAKIVYRRATADAQALPRARRRQEPPDRDARRRRRDDRGERGRLDERMRRPALHGGVGDGRRRRRRVDHREDGAQGARDGARDRHRSGDFDRSRRSGSSTTSTRRSRTARRSSSTAATPPCTAARTATGSDRRSSTT